MLEHVPLLPSIMLIGMVVITLILLPYLHDERRRDDERGKTHELHLRERRSDQSHRG